MTEREAIEVVRFLLAAYPTQRQRMKDDDVRGMVAAYSAGLLDLEMGAAQAAISRIARTEKWLPTIAEIRAAVGVLAHGQQTTGLEAWGIVVAAMRRYGSHRTPGQDFTFGDPLIARVVKAMGWYDLTHSKDATADRARFVDSYEEIARQERIAARARDGAVSAVLPAGKAPAQLAALPPAPEPALELQATPADVRDQFLADMAAKNPSTRGRA